MWENRFDINRYFQVYQAYKGKPYAELLKAFKTGMGDYGSFSWLDFQYEGEIKSCNCNHCIFNEENYHGKNKQIVKTKFKLCKPIVDLKNIFWVCSLFHPRPLTKEERLANDREFQEKQNLYRVEKRQCAEEMRQAVLKLIEKYPENIDNPLLWTR